VTRRKNEGLHKIETSHLQPVPTIS
jgi:hypothetical protein